MSVAKHYTEWSKEDKDALARQRMEEMMRKNEEIKRRYAEVEADRKKAEQQNSSVTVAVRSKSPPRDPGYKFHDDSSRNRAGGHEDCYEGPRRNFSNSGSGDFRNTRQDSRRPQEKEFSRGSNTSMSKREREDYEKWKAERKKIDEERIARHKVKCEWDEGKVEQESEQKPVPSSKFYREPSWAKQDDQLQRRDLNQREHYRGNDRNFKNTKQNYESEDPNFRDKSSKSFGRSRNNDFSSADRHSRTSLSDDEDNRYDGRQQRYDRPNNYSSYFRKNQDSSSSYNSRGRGRGGGFSQAARNEYRSNVNPPFNENSSLKSLNSTESNFTRPTRVYNSSDSCTDSRKDSRDAGYQNRFHENEYSHSKSRVRQNKDTWSNADDVEVRTNIQPSAQRSGNSRTKQSTGSTWSDDDGCDANTKSDRVKQNLDNWSSADDVGVRTNLQPSAQRSGNSRTKQSTGSTWSDDDGCDANTKSDRVKQNLDNWSNADDVGVRTNMPPSARKSVISGAKQISGSTWSDDDGRDANTKMDSRGPLQRSNSSKFKQTSGSTWSDNDGHAANMKMDSRGPLQRSNSSKFKQTSGSTWSDDDGHDADTKVDSGGPLQRSNSSKFKQTSGNTWSDDDGHDASKKMDSRRPLQRSNSSKFKQTSGSTWSDDDSPVNVKTNPKTSSQRTNSTSSKTGSKHTGGTWSDDDANVKATSRQCSETKSSSVSSKDHISSGTWSDVDDSAEKSKNDGDGWLDPSDKNWSYNSKCSDYVEKSRKFTGWQPPKSYPGGRGRKWSFESSREVRNILCGGGDLKSENKTIKLDSDDNVTVTIGNFSGDMKGSRSFPQRNARNDESHFRIAKRTPEAVRHSFPDGDKHDFKRHDASGFRKRFNESYEYQQNARNFRGRGGSLNKSTFPRNSSEKSFEDPNNWGKSSRRGEYSSGAEERSQNRFQDRGRGGFQRGHNRGARRFGETRRFPENVGIPNDKPWQNHEPAEGWGEPTKGNSAATVQAEDIWEDVEASESADLDSAWATDDTHKVQSLGSVLESHICESERQSGGDEWISESNYSQVGSSKSQNESKNQAHQDRWESDENTCTADIKQTIHQEERSPCREHLSNQDCACDESHDDSWVTTSGDEEIGEGEFIDDDESLHISCMQQYVGDDSSSPEPNIPKFVCSMTEYLNLSKVPKVCHSEDGTEIAKIHDANDSKHVTSSAPCSPTRRLGNLEKTQSLFHKPNSGHTEFFKYESCSTAQTSLEHDSSDVTKSIGESDIIASGTEKCESDGQQFLVLSSVHSDEQSDSKVSETDDFDHRQKVMPETQLTSTTPLTSEIFHLIQTDEDCKPLYGQDVCETTCELEQQNIHSSTSCGHSESGTVPACDEVLCASGDDSVSGLKSFAEDLDQNSCMADDSLNLADPLCNETVSSPDIKCSGSALEEYNESYTFENAGSLQNFEEQGGGVCSASGDFIETDDDNHRWTGVPSEEKNTSQAICDEQVHESVSEHSGGPAGGLCDKAGVQDESLLTAHLTDDTTSITTHSKTATPAEDAEHSESVPVEHSCVTTNTTENI